MKVLHLVKTGHGATWAVQQVTELVARGVEVHVAVPAGPQAPRYAAAGAQVHLVQPGLVPTRPPTWRAAVRTVDDLVRTVRPDLVHSHFVGTTLAMRRSAAARSVPRLFQVPGPLHLENAVTRGIEIASADRGDHWIASCSWVRSAYLRAGVPAERLHLSRYGSVLPAEHPVAAVDLRRELGLPAGRHVLGMVAYAYPPKRYLGQHRGIKGHEDLIDAAALLVGGGTDLQVVFVGGPWVGGEAYLARIRARAERRIPGRHTFLGTRTDVPALYPAFDVAVHPSLSENLGGAAESMLAGIPTVASDVGGFPDLVQPGTTGWLSPARDPQALAAVIGSVLADPGQAGRVALAGRAHARALLDVRQTAREVEQIYRRVLA